mmetsp:Transcript_9719/g.29981  ORF Transcript_9719/g.29981 Transcript_9719/m.29981 type:complete len:270 (+) Transcript_9719:722-1531(+)
MKTASQSTVLPRPRPRPSNLVRSLLCAARSPHGQPITSFRIAVRRWSATHERWLLARAPPRSASESGQHKKQTSSRRSKRRARRRTARKVAARSERRPFDVSLSVTLPNWPPSWASLFHQSPERRPVRALCQPLQCAAVRSWANRAASLPVLRRPPPKMRRNRARTWSRRPRVVASSPMCEQSKARKRIWLQVTLVALGHWAAFQCARHPLFSNWSRAGCCATVSVRVRRRLQDLSRMTIERSDATLRRPPARYRSPTSRRWWIIRATC